MNVDEALISRPTHDTLQQSERWFLLQQKRNYEGIVNACKREIARIEKRLGDLEEGAQSAA